MVEPSKDLQLVFDKAIKDAQNEDFETESFEFMDFTETNPFGEPESS